MTHECVCSKEIQRRPTSELQTNYLERQPCIDGSKVIILLTDWNKAREEAPLQRGSPLNSSIVLDLAMKLGMLLSQKQKKLRKQRKLEKQSKMNKRVTGSLS
jgi:hypothetical protein